MLAALAIVEATSARQESATFDEGAYLAAGYSYLKTGDFRMNVEHPPLAKILCALPLLLLNPRLPLEDASWARAMQQEFAGLFLYHNRVPADSILLAGRGVTVALTLLFGLAVALWTRKHFGIPAALLALFLFVTDPNLTAHGRYATNDLPVALFFFLAVAAWGRYLLRRRWWELLWSGAALGLALLTKSSAILLIPIFTVLYLCRAWQEEDTEKRATHLSVERFFAAMLALAVVSVALILPAYAFQASLCQPGQTPAYECTLAAVTDAGSLASHFLAALTRAFHLPDHPFVLGLFEQFLHNQSGHPAYLLGRQSPDGWWYYYLVAFLVKAPTALVALALLALACGAGYAARARLVRWRAVPFQYVLLTVPILVYGASALASRIDLGVRFLLPIYPFVIVLAAAALLRLRRALPYLVALVVAVQTAEAVAIYPYHLAFFNTLSGGPRNGPRYLLDSNIDWGQDLKRLKHYLDRNQVRSVCLSYFGYAEPSYYGISFRPLPITEEDSDCVAAISVTDLYDVYGPRGKHSWLRRRQPVARVGYSIYIYDLRKAANSGGKGAGFGRGQFR